jgi:hypothetical protein
MQRRMRAHIRFVNGVVVMAVTQSIFSFKFTCIKPNYLPKCKAKLKLKAKINTSCLDCVLMAK